MSIQNMNWSVCRSYVILLWIFMYIYGIIMVVTIKELWIAKNIKIHKYK